MSKKAFRPPRLAPLQRVVGEPVTDPDEIAAMEEVHKRIKQIQKKNKPLVVYRDVKKTPKTKTKAKKKKSQDS